MRGPGKAKKVLAYELGKSGEDVAVEYLKRKKYKIVSKGFRFLRGEIDIIAYEGETLVLMADRGYRETHN